MKPLPRWGRRVLALALVGSVLCLGMYVSRAFWFRQIRAYMLGYAYVTAEDNVRLLPETDRLEIYAMPGHGRADEPRPEVKINGDSWPYVRRVELHGVEAERIAGFWRRVHWSMGSGGMCHDPGYCLRFYGPNGLLMETSVCWDCHNFSLPAPLLGKMLCGFDADAEPAQTLLAQLRTVAPIPNDPPATGP